ncbi:glyoxalase/bleomycin resistance/dioxygenase family protein [Reinekea marina]|uniref:VOC family protein n=1 Tax=Reinekea marina TaxID=1310421 RepID=A0ABV7WVI5_9GAMM|nr:VOC family protein [Reinekea marina]MDN3650034.1 glyoxalase/bleomycin resistance/dioxygenase family protein [Reinekea marina]
MKPIANLIHVEDLKLGLDWYQKAFPDAIVRTIDDFTFLEVNGFALELVLADEKVGSGKSGSVTYWLVESLEYEMERFKSIGSIIYRGPMEIEANQWMCQVTDPFGNLIGLRGPF